MSIQGQIREFIDSQAEPKRSDLQTLHDLILKVKPKSRLWFLDGRDGSGKVVSNPNIGYGQQQLKQAGGKTREFYQVGISPNTTGISVYIMGIDDKDYLSKSFGKTLGKASITGYCIKFKKLSDINIDVLESAIRYGIGATGE